MKYVIALILLTAFAMLGIVFLSGCSTAARADAEFRHRVSAVTPTVQADYDASTGDWHTMSGARIEFRDSSK